MQSRRNVMAFLGLASATGPALATTAMARSPAGDENPQLRVNHEHVVEALRRLAAGIETGEVNVTTLNVSSTIQPDDWLEQILTLKFELLLPKV